MKPKVYMKLQDIGVRFNSTRSLIGSTESIVLHGISFDIMKGDTIGLIGRNGAGKSTLLKLMAGIIGADDGKIETCAQSISLLSLNLGFEPNLSGRDNAILNGMLLGFSKTKVQEKLSDIINFSELSDSIDRPIKTYSSGMLARLAFSISLQMSPDIILIDEGT